MIINYLHQRYKYYDIHLKIKEQKDVVTTIKHHEFYIQCFLEVSKIKKELNLSTSLNRRT